MKCVLVIAASSVAAVGCDDWQRLSKNYGEGIDGSAGAGGSSGGQGCTAPRALPCASGAWVCDDFEAATLSNIWAKNEINGSVRVEDSPSCGHGTRSLHLRTEFAAKGTATEARLKRDITTALQPHHYGRAFVYFQNPIFVPGSIISLMKLFSEGSPESLSLTLEDGTVSILNQFSSNPDQGTQVTITTDRWVCVSWEVESKVGGALVVRYADGLGPEQTLFDGVFADIPLPGVPARIFLGLDVSPSTTQDALDVWLDDVVIDDEPIGCSS